VVQGLELGAEEEAGRPQQLQLRLGDPDKKNIKVFASVVDPNSFFSYSDPQFLFGFGSLYLYFYPKFFQLVPLIAFLCVLESVQMRKKFTNGKRFFLFQVFDLRFFTKFLFYNSVWIRIRIQIRTFFSDSDPAKIFGLFRIRIHNTGFHHTFIDKEY
jgi:hypothetical protein